MKKNIWTLAVLQWMCLTFWFSAKTADESAHMSRSVGYLAGELFVEDFREWTPQQQDAFAEWIDHFVRKSAHATEYAVLGILFGGMYASWGLWGRKHFLLAAGSGILYAATDEFHQLFVPGRSGQLSDVLLDSCGVLAGAVLYIGAVWLVRRWKIRRKKENII